jgi:DNA-binding MarR family transcriptional regulator
MSIEEEIQQTSFRNPKQRAAINLIFTGNWLMDRQQAFFRNFGITASQFNILRILRGRHPQKISVREIGLRMLDKNSDVPRLLDRLLTKELVSKVTCEKDKRAADVAITPAGLDLLEKLDPYITEMEKQIIGLDEDEAIMLSNLLDKLRG